MQKSLFIVLCFVTFSFNIFSVSAFNKDIQVVVNGSIVDFPDARPFINKDSRTLVPVRFISNSLGAEVNWIPKEKNVIIKKSQKEISLTIGINESLIDGYPITFDTKPILKENRTFVPLRFIAEAFGADVNWNEENNTIIINNSQIPKENTDKIPLSDYFNELYNLFVYIPEGMEENPYGKLGDYIFDEEGNIIGFDFNLEDKPSEIQIPKGLSPYGAVFTNYSKKPDHEFSIEVYKNVNRTKEMLLSQFVYSSNFDPTELLYIENENIKLVCTKEFQGINIETLEFYGTQHKLFFYDGKNLFVFSFTSAENSEALSTELIEKVFNSIEINGTKILLKTSVTPKEKIKIIEDIILEKGTNTKYLTQKQNELRLKEKYFLSKVDNKNMIVINGGEFIDEYGESVSIDTFYISKNLITLNEWNEVMESQHKINIDDYNSRFSVKIESGDFPAVFEIKSPSDMPEIKDSYQIYNFCNAKSRLENLESNYSFLESEYGITTLFEDKNGYRLPSEDELKYILRKNKNDPFNNKVDLNVLSKTGTKKPNVFGVYDYNSNIPEVSDFGYLYKLAQNAHTLCGFRLARNVDNSSERTIINAFFSSKEEPLSN